MVGVRLTHGHRWFTPAAGGLIACVTILAGCLGLAPSEPAAKPSATASAPSPARPALAHFDDGGIAFDYEADWTLTRIGVNVRYGEIIAFVGTRPAGPACTFSVDGANCSLRAHPIEPGGVLVEISTRDGPGPLRVTDLPADGGTRTLVGGMPAIESAGLQAVAPGVDRALHWVVAMPRTDHGMYEIDAEIRAPELDRRETQVRALVASFRFDPPVVPLPVGAAGDTAAATAARTALAALRAHSHQYDCFPTVPGMSRHATIVEPPMGPVLAQPAGATCTTTVAPSDLQLWKITLRVEWDEPGTSIGNPWTTVVWVAPDGTVLGSEGYLGPEPSGSSDAP